MTMTLCHRLGIGVLVLSFAACGGNYSNDDVLFPSAVPDETVLASKLKDGTAAMRWAPNADVGLTTGGPSTAAVGDVSGVAKFTVGASQAFNDALFTILDVLEKVVSLEPSVRKPNERIWGPFPDSNHAGFEVQLVMTRSGDQFDYEIDARHQGTSEAWTKVGAGDFLASGTLRRGTGSLHYLQVAARAIGYDLTTGDSAGIDVSYQTAGEPVTVDLVVPSQTNPVPILAISYAGAADGSGQMRFDVTGQLAGGSSSPIDTLDVLSRWKSDGSGRADAEMIAGDYVGATYVECWSTADTILYSAASWSTPQGVEASCPVF